MELEHVVAKQDPWCPGIYQVGELTEASKKERELGLEKAEVQECGL